MSQAPELRGDERVLYLHSTGTTPAMWRRVPPAAFGGAVGLAPAHIGYPPNAPLPRGVTCRAEEDAAQALLAGPGGDRALVTVQGDLVINGVPGAEELPQRVEGEFWRIDYGQSPRRPIS